MLQLLKIGVFPFPCEWVNAPDLAIVHFQPILEDDGTKATLNRVETEVQERMSPKFEPSLIRIPHVRRISVRKYLARDIDPSATNGQAGHEISGK